MIAPPHHRILYASMNVINLGHNYNQCALISINMIVLIRVKFKYSLSGTDFISVERNCNEYFHVRL